MRDLLAGDKTRIALKKFAAGFVAVQVFDRSPPSRIPFLTPDDVPPPTPLSISVKSLRRLTQAGFIRPRVALVDGLERTTWTITDTGRMRLSLGKPGRVWDGDWGDGAEAGAGAVT